MLCSTAATDSGTGTLSLPAAETEPLTRIPAFQAGRQWPLMPVPDGILWFWIGSHADYDKLLNR